MTLSSATAPTTNDENIIKSQDKNVVELKDEPKETHRKPLTRSQSQKQYNKENKAVKGEELNNYNRDNVFRTDNVCRYVDVYRKRRVEKMKKIQQQQNEMRKFEAKPMPNFSNAHRKIQEKAAEYRILPLVPITPKTLANSLAAQEKRNKRVSKYLIYSNQSFIQFTSLKSYLY